MTDCVRSLLAVVFILAISRVSAPADETADVQTKAAVTDAPIEQLGDEACRAIAQFYDYDKTIPLEARLVEKVTKDGLLREKIVIRGAQGFLVPAYVQLPPQGDGPFPCVLLLHGWSGSKEHWWTDSNYISGGIVRKALLEAGYAIFAIDAQCHGDRIAQNDFAPVNHYVDKEAAGPQRRGYFSQQEIYIQTTRDYRRGIDYLESRSDIDKSRIGAVGYSMGGAQTFLLTGVEPRIRAAVAVAAPAEKSKWSPIAPQNFLRGLGDRPFLTIIGRSDELCPLEHALKLQSMIMSKTKDQVLFDAGHKLPPTYVPHAIDWIGKHL